METHCARCLSIKELLKRIEKLHQFFVIAIKNNVY